MRVAGFGFRRAAGLESFRAALDLAGGRVDALATAADKAGGLQALAQALNLPVIAVSPEAMAAHKIEGSQRVTAIYGTGSVAESAALVAAGPRARIVVSRVISPDRMVVVAIAEGAP